MIVPVEKIHTDKQLSEEKIVINIPFPQEKEDKSQCAHCCSDFTYFIIYIIKYVSIFFMFSFIGKIGAKFIYWANETNHWKYPDGWEWGDINEKIFLQALIGVIISMILFGMCCAK